MTELEAAKQLLTWYPKKHVSITKEVGIFPFDGAAEPTTEEHFRGYVAGFRSSVVRHGWTEGYPTLEEVLRQLKPEEEKQ